MQGTVLAENGVAARIPLPPAMELRGIDKRFGAVHANRAVDLVVERGSIHGIIGENGAGKSTLMSILYGFYEADAGEIRIGGQKVAMRSSSDAIRNGIAMVHQHFMLVDTLTVLENVILGMEGERWLRPAIARARLAVLALERDYRLQVDPDALAGDLPVGALQRVEILKALYRGAEILILDEPTGVLTPQEADHLFRVLGALRDQGKTVILITHKLREIMAITDVVSVMRAGRMVAHRRTAETSPAELGELMIGRKLAQHLDKPPLEAGATRLAVADLRVRDPDGIERVKGVSFTVRAGEIVGIAGVSGNGQSELLEALAAIRTPASGTIAVGETTVFPGPDFTPASLRRHHVVHVPEDRLRMGLVPSFPACQSAILGYQDDTLYGAGPLFDWNAVERDTAGKMQDYDVRPRQPKLKSANLSGGNQQKLILARELEHAPAVVLVGQPTRGVDIGGIAAIHARLLAMRAGGCAVLLVSVELDEILRLADRILVMFDGYIVGELDVADATETRLGLLMAGERAA